MEFVIITGMSGAGKTGALHVLEDIGYYCVDNLPSSLLSTLYKLCLKSEDDSMKRVAVVVDVRGNEKFDPLSEKLKDGSVLSAVELERELLLPVKRIADYNIDTTYMSNKQLRERIMSMFMEDTSQGITLTFMSFGFKYGIPLEADLIMDVRCLPNPFYIPELKHLTGLDKKVRDYVLESDETTEFLKRLLNMLDFSVPLYLKEGKSELVVGIGCTGGKHRSVTIAMQLNAHFHEKGYKCVIQHRDIDR